MTWPDPRGTGRSLTRTVLGIHLNFKFKFSDSEFVSKVGRGLLKSALFQIAESSLTEPDAVPTVTVNASNRWMPAAAANRMSGPGRHWQGGRGAASGPGLSPGPYSPAGPCDRLSL